MKKLLIIRSVSIQQLDKNMPAIMEKYADYSIHILTHEHSKNMVEKYTAIDRIFVYPYKGSFSPRRRVKELSKQYYDEIIIPVTNVSGAGFLNVLLFSLTIKGKQRTICNLVSDMWPVSKWKICWMTCKSIFFSVFAFLCTAIMGVLLMGWPLLLKAIERKRLVLSEDRKAES